MSEFDPDLFQKSEEEIDHMDEEEQDSWVDKMSCQLDSLQDDVVEGNLRDCGSRAINCLAKLFPKCKRSNTAIGVAKMLVTFCEFEASGYLMLLREDFLCAMMRELGSEEADDVILAVEIISLLFSELCSCAEKLVRDAEYAPIIKFLTSVGFRDILFAKLDSNNERIVLASTLALVHFYSLLCAETGDKSIITRSIPRCREAIYFGENVVGLVDRTSDDSITCRLLLVLTALVTDDDSIAAAADAHTSDTAAQPITAHTASYTPTQELEDSAAAAAAAAPPPQYKSVLYTSDVAVLLTICARESVSGKRPAATRMLFLRCLAAALSRVDAREMPVTGRRSVRDTMSEMCSSESEDAVLRQAAEELLVRYIDLLD